MNEKILVIGSSNTDMVVQSATLPVPGETILGGEFLMNPGGKGANQAVAAAKLEGNVTFITSIGQDVFGEEALKGFKNHGIDTSYIIQQPDLPSGVALIMVDKKGENCISVASGANNALDKEVIDKAKNSFDNASYLLMQLEVPLETVSYAAEIAFDQGIKIILNPAPAQKLPDDLLAKLYMITPNETEVKLLTGVDVTDETSALEAANVLRTKGVKIVIITLGKKGAFVVSDNMQELISPPQVKAIDTTAAGDTFNGALVVGLAEGMTLKEAVQFANKAAAFSVTRLGAQSSTPLKKELN